MQPMFEICDPRFLSCVIALLLILKQVQPGLGYDYFPPWEEIERWAHFFWAQAVAGLVAAPRCKSAWLGALLIVLLTFGFFPWLLWGHSAARISGGSWVSYAIYFRGHASPLLICLSTTLICGLFSVGVRADLGWAHVWTRSFSGSLLFATSWFLLVTALRHVRIDWRYAEMLRCVGTPILFAATYWTVILFGRNRRVRCYQSSD